MDVEDVNAHLTRLDGLEMLENLRKQVSTASCCAEDHDTISSCARIWCGNFALQMRFLACEIVRGLRQESRRNTPRCCIIR